jgi:Ran GTPase-activating protein (RanGAP) involved in mRNA processing and transport
MASLDQPLKEAYKWFLLKSYLSHHHLEALCILVARRPTSSSCSIFLQSRRQNLMNSEMLVMESRKGLEPFAMQKRKKRVKRIFIKGVPGIGKSTLCLFFIDEWLNGKAFGEFEIVLFFPLRRLKPHSEMPVVSNYELLHDALTQIQIYKVPLCSSLFHYLMKYDGEGVLIIADGWDELNEKERHPGGLPYELLFGGLLSHASVIVTSRPVATGIPLEVIDKCIEILGFNKETIKKYVQSEFTDNPQKGHRLMKEMESNPTLKCMCTIPLNCAIACHLHRSAGLEELHINTKTKLYNEYVLTLIHVLDDRSAGFLQKVWSNLCELAFSSTKNNLLVFSQKEVSSVCPWNEAILSFKLLHSFECGTEETKYQFLHLTLQEYLAALHMTNKMSALEQNDTYKLYGGCSRFEQVWEFFLGLRSLSTSDSESFDAIKSSIISTEISTLTLKDCHLAFEADDMDFSNQLMNKGFNPTFITPTAYDYATVLHGISYIQDCSDMSLDVSSCILDQTDLSMLAEALAKIVKCEIKNLALSGNKLSDKDIVHIFSKASSKVEKLNLHDNQVGENGVKFIAKAIPELKSLQLSHNPLGISGIHALGSAIISGALTDIRELELQGSMTEDRNTNDELLQELLEIISDRCNEIQLLDISENCISKRSTKSLAKILSLKPLRLLVNETTLGNEGFEAFINAMSCEGEYNIESLEMKSNHINSKGIQFLVEKVSSGMLLKGGIHLDENPLGMEAVLSIGQLLSNTHCLLSDLSLTDCQLSENISHDTSITANYVYRHLLQISQYSGLSQLKLDCNNFTEDSLQILTGFIHLCPYLKFLSSRCCQLTSVDLNALLTKLFEEKVHAEKLTTWCLANCNIGNDGVRDLIKYVPLIFPNLTDIHLDGNPVSAEVKSKLKETLSDNVKIKEKGNVHYDRVEADGGQPQDQSTLTYCRGV